MRAHASRAGARGVRPQARPEPLCARADGSTHLRARARRPACGQPPRAAQLSRKRGASDAAADDRAKKPRASEGAAKPETKADEPVKATRGATKATVGGDGAGTSSQPAARQLRVKLTGAPHLLREGGAGAVGGGAPDDAQPPDAPPGAHVPAAGAGAGAVVGGAGGGQFAPGTPVILTNGKITYEAEVRASRRRAAGAGRGSRSGQQRRGARIALASPLPRSGPA